MKATYRRSTDRDWESELALQLQGIGLPAPETQFRYAPPRKFAADLAYPEAKLLIEVTGGVFTGGAHGSILGILKDNERLNEATLAGYRVMRFVPDQVDNGEALAVIERFLRGDNARCKQ